MDIAYHYAIDSKGNVYQGRAEHCAGDTFTNYDPTGHLLIMLDGNFEQQQPTPEAIASLQKMIEWASQQYNVDTQHMHYHRQLAATACPGEKLIQVIESGSLFSSAQTTVQLRLLPKEEGDQRVQQIKNSSP